ncbi:unnamed protein product [Ixodes pacificus]
MPTSLKSFFLANLQLIKTLFIEFLGALECLPSLAESRGAAGAHYTGKLINRLDRRAAEEAMVPMHAFAMKVIAPSLNAPAVPNLLPGLPRYVKRSCVCVSEKGAGGLAGWLFVFASK